MSLAADHLVANIVHESSLYRNLRLQRPGEQGREDAELGGEDGQMLTTEDLSRRCVFGNSSLRRCWGCWWRFSLSAAVLLLMLLLLSFLCCGFVRCLFCGCCPRPMWIFIRSV